MNKLLKVIKFLLLILSTILLFIVLKEDDSSRFVGVLNGYFSPAFIILFFIEIVCLFFKGKKLIVKEDNKYNIIFIVLYSLICFILLRELFDNSLVYKFEKNIFSDYDVFYFANNVPFIWVINILLLVYRLTFIKLNKNKEELIVDANANNNTQ